MENGVAIPNNGVPAGQPAPQAALAYDASKGYPLGTMGE